MTLTAIITPFLEDYSIDWESLQSIVIRQLQSDINGLVILATTSESPTLTNQEKIQIVELVTKLNEQYGKDVWAGVSSNSTTKVIQRIHELKDYPLRGFMACSPWYNKPDQDGLLNHFSAIAATTNKELMVYNVPSRTGININPETYLALANKCSNITVIKEASSDIQQCIDAVKLIREHNLLINILSGNDDMIISQLAIGFHGVVSVVSNLYPDACSQLVNNFNFDLNLSQQIYFRLLDSIRASFAKTNPISIKSLLKQNNLISNDQVRLPLVR